MERQCCSFGKQFGEEYDETFRQLSVPKAASHFGVTRWAVEQHRKCLGMSGAPATPADPKSLPPVALAPIRNVAAEDRADEDKHPRQLEREERIKSIAKLMLTGAWREHLAFHFEREWRVTRETMQKYVLDAARMQEELRGGLLVERQASIGVVTKIRDAAMEKEDWKGAIAAQVHRDKITGVLATPGNVNLTQINVHQDSAFSECWRVIAQALKPYPQALAAAERALDNLASGRTSDRDVITVDAERHDDTIAANG